MKSFSYYFENFLPDWLSFSLAIGISTVPAYRHLPAFIVAPGSVTSPSIEWISSPNSRHDVSEIVLTAM